ncbi:MAG TPA: putative peptidoglycan glycosyltransferase FtsW [Hyphomicrobiaceae bacterium]|nr:putative peptidoglycan glycosyltransferase FtsW [Hyphomicrobiaceae bacterium]
MRLSRTDDSLLAEWWLTVDRLLIAAAFALMAAGVVLSLAASPAVAIKKGLEPFHFVERHVVWAVIAAGVMLWVSLLSARQARRLALLIFLGALATMIFVLVMGPDINGARRWLRIAGLSVQPSELAKPAFVVLAAWALNEATERRDVPAIGVGVVLYGAFAVLLALQPDVGQTLLVTAVFGALFLLSGLSLKWVGALAGAGVAGLAVAYQAFPHVRRRIDRFIDPQSGETYQTDRALQSFLDGGFFGRGPGEGTIKAVLPDAHTDFIMAVVAEEYGILACLGLLLVFAFIVFRSIIGLARAPDGFVRLAVTGLALLIGLQALINMSVSVGLIPPKGMTLPFVSSGGSSGIASALTMGLLLALRRWPADARRVKLPEFGLGSPLAAGTAGAKERS